MGTRSATLPPGKTSDKVVRQQLSRILGSKTFSQVERLKRFINFIVGETVGGRGGDLKEYVIGVQVFGKEPSFDPRTDPIVRVQARRLRTRLARYYRDEGNSDELIVDLPKGGYAPVFRPRDEAPAAKRSLTATLVGRNTVAVMPLADDSAGREPRLFLPRPARRDRARADLDQGAARAGGARRRRPQRPGRRDPRRRGAADHRRRSFRARSAARHDPSGRRRERLLPVVGVRRSSISRSGRRPGSDRQAHRREAGAGSRQRSARRDARRNPTTSPRAISTCRAATTSISGPKKACTRRSSSSRRRSSRTRSSRWRTAASPTPTACSRITACSVPPMCGRRRRRARRRR